MAIFHQELGQVCTTMYLQGSAADNTVCKMHANDTVAACAAGNDFIGVVVTENAKKYRVLRVDTAAKTVGLYL